MIALNLWKFFGNYVQCIETFFKGLRCVTPKGRNLY